MNFGPAHPSAHGVLRCMLWLTGELVTKAHIATGLLHRSSEKLCEFRHHLCSVPYFNRLDYVSMSTNEHAYCLSLESLWGILCSLSDSLARLYIVELTRSLNHYLALSCHSADVGSVLPVLWLFEDRECLYLLSSFGAGARLHLLGVVVLLFIVVVPLRC